jgi:hypothetical protein
MSPFKRVEKKTQDGWLPVVWEDIRVGDVVRIHEPNGTYSKEMVVKSMPIGANGERDLIAEEVPTEQSKYAAAVLDAAFNGRPKR